MFKDGSISTSNCEKLRTFSEEFCVEEKHVVSYVKHLEQLATVASIRERAGRLNRTIEEGRQNQDYNWSDLIESGKLDKLKVKELDKYLKEHKLPSAGNKPDKLKRITQISISEIARRPPQKTSQLNLRVILFGNPLTRMTTIA